MDLQPPQPLRRHGEWQRLYKRDRYIVQMGPVRAKWDAGQGTILVAWDKSVGYQGKVYDVIIQTNENPPKEEILGRMQKADTLGADGDRIPKAVVKWVEDHQDDIWTYVDKIPGTEVVEWVEERHQFDEGVYHAGINMAHIKIK